jgi:pyruvate/2-oxoglutarate dehydrogenase complex dihydrolipoamide acyltransferase (E2) component
MFSKNVELLPKLKLSSWRKISMGSWRPVGDSQVYSIMELDAGPAMRYLEKLRESGEKVTLTHLAGRVAGQMIAENPSINSLVRFGNLYPRKNIDIFFHVVGDDPEDLSGHKVEDIDQKSILDIAQEMKPRVKVIRTGDDENFKKIKSSMRLLPAFLSKTLLDILGFVMYALNIWSPLFATPKDCFGSMMITNIGTLGLVNGMVPLPAYSRTPMVLALGKIVTKPVFDDAGNVIAQPTMQACWTFDHRVIDGAHGAKMAKSFEKYFTNPDLLG